MNVYGYLRQSGKDEGAQTIEGQRSRIEAWSAYTQAGDVEFVPADVGVSGGMKFVQRPGGAHLMKRARPGDTAVVTTLDRLGRDTRDILDTVEEFATRGVRLVILDLNIDTATPVGEMMLTVSAALATHERKQVSERMVKAWKELDRQGRHHGKVPFGFEAVPNPNGAGKVLRPHPVNGPWLHEAAGRIMRGGTISAEAEKLGKATASLSRLLRNPKLYGMTPQTGRIDPEAAILTVGEWQRLQKVLERPARAVHKTESWSRMTRCYKCGYPLYRVRREEANWADVYRCTRLPRHDGAPTVRQHIVDDMIEDRFSKHYAHLPLIELTEKISGGDVAIIDAEMKAVTEAMLTTDDVAPLVVRLSDLKRQRADTKQEIRKEWHRTKLTAADVKEQVLPLVIEITVYPASVTPRVKPTLTKVEAFARLGEDYTALRTAPWNLSVED